MKGEEIDWAKVAGVEIDPERQSGAPVFEGTRVPVSVVTNNLRQSDEWLLNNFSVTRQQITLVRKTLKPARRSRPQS